MCIHSNTKIICEHHCELVSPDMLYLALISKFSRTKNQNSRISNVGCKNISFELTYAKKLKLQLPWAFCNTRLKKAFIKALVPWWNFFSVLTRVKESPLHCLLTFYSIPAFKSWEIIKRCFSGKIFTVKKTRTVLSSHKKFSPIWYIVILII